MRAQYSPISPGYNLLEVVQSYKYALIGSVALHILFFIFSTQNTLTSIPLMSAQTKPQPLQIQIQKSQPRPIDLPKKIIKPVPKITKFKALPKPVVTAPTATSAPKVTEPVIPTKTFKESILKNQKPRYPRLAQRKGWSGRVTLKLLVKPNGSVQSVKVLSSPDYKGFETAALEAAKKWKFHPSKTNSGFYVKKVIAFTLKN